MMIEKDKYSGLEIAIIGMSGKFPGASDVNQFWNNLVEGRESIRFFEDHDLISKGISEELLKNDKYVKAAAHIDDAHCFDSVFFNYHEDEVRSMDPQVRLFHQCVWEALEDSGYSRNNLNKTVGVYAGLSDNIYWKAQSAVKRHIHNSEMNGSMFLNNEGSLATLVANKLNLKGPAVTINTACSTSLVAVHLACRNLLTGDSQIAIAGGVSLPANRSYGYVYEPNMINSVDGHCRAFDEKSSGTIGGEGVGVVVLKKLNKAINDRDNIYAVIKGSAINNDGNRKVGYTAPSVEGQAECIKMAHKFSRIDPSTISYIETHGTGTQIGDPIEIEALNMALNSQVRNSCAIGSVKSNLGHLDAAAGVTGLIKTVLMLKHKKIPPSLHFNKPNANINFEAGPLYVNDKLSDWKNDSFPLRAGISSFGIGGTNAHVIVEQAPDTTREISGNKHQYNVYTLSAKSQNALKNLEQRFKSHFKQQEGLNPADVAFTLGVGRKDFPYRKSFVASDSEFFKYAATQKFPFKDHFNNGQSAYKVFMFPGQGSQLAQVGSNLYYEEPVFRQHMDEGFFLLKKLTDKDFKKILFNEGSKGLNGPQLKKTENCQPLIFLIQYSLAKLLEKWGITPDCLIGHSLGEYTASCISGVISFEDTLKLVCKRGELMGKLPEGDMISILLGKNEVEQYLTDEITLAAVNKSDQCVLSGPKQAIDHVISDLERNNIIFKRLETSHAFHSSMMDSILEEFRNILKDVPFDAPKIPYISNVTGSYITHEDLANREYWVKHLRDCVQFYDGINSIREVKNKIFIDFGPGTVLSSLVKGAQNTENIINLLPHTEEPELKGLVQGICDLWLHGVNVDWQSYYSHRNVNLRSLPTYPFDKLEYPYEINFNSGYLNELGLNNIQNKGNSANLYEPTWRKTIINNYTSSLSTSYDVNVIFVDDAGLGSLIIEKLSNLGQRSIVVKKGESFSQIDHSTFEVNPKNPKNYQLLFNSIDLNDESVIRIIHLWSIFDVNELNAISLIQNPESYFEQGYLSLLNISNVLNESMVNSSCSLELITNDTFDISGSEVLIPHNLPFLALRAIISQQFSGISLRNIDISLTDQKEDIVEKVLELFINQTHSEIALRNGKLWRREYSSITNVDNSTSQEIFKQDGTYIVNEGFSTIGKVFTNYLNSKFNANIILIGRNELSEYDNKLIEESKGTIRYYNLNVEDEKEVLNCLNEVIAHYGKIDGYIDAAESLEIQQMHVTEILANYQNLFVTKLKETYTLLKCFDKRKLDFLIFCSPIIADFHPLGEMTNSISSLYNSYLSKSGEGQNIISISWDALATVNQTLLDSVHNNQALTEDECVKILQTCVQMGISNGIVYLGDPYFLQNPDIDIQGPTMIDETKHMERPSISSAFIPPVNELEEKLIGYVKKVLGLKKVGRLDDFFELGGDSLKAMMLLKVIHKELEVEIFLKDFFSMPNVKSLAEEIENLKWMKGDRKKNNEIII
jgi:acyl transferase domain-containing protein/acyl carrier protein